MRNKAPLAVVLSLTVAVVLSAGCSEGKSRQAGQELRDAVDQAGQLYASALALVESPYLEDSASDERVTYLENPTEEKLENYRAVSRRDVNPEALKLLDRAEQRLREAMRDYADAADADKAIARAMLGRVTLLRGQCNVAIAESMHARLFDAMAKARSVTATIQMQQGVADFYQQMLQRSNEYVEDMIAQAREEAEGLRQELSRLDERLSDWQEQRREVISANEQLYAQARNFRIESRQAEGVRATELLEEALSAEAERHENESLISELEHRIEHAEADRRGLQVEMESAEGRIAGGQEILDARDRLVAEADGELTDKLSELRSQIENQQSLRDELLREMLDTLERLTTTEGEAAGDFEVAADSFSQAARLTGREEAAAYLALQADSLASNAELNARRLRLRGRMESVLGGDVADTAVVQEALEYLSNAAEVGEAVVSEYEEAVQLYSRAAGQAQRDLRWVYDAETAATAIELYRFSGDSEHRQLAEDALEELEDMMDSPQLRPLAELRMKLAGNG